MMMSSKETWVYDLKWIPDIRAGRPLFNMDQAAADSPVDLAVWNKYTAVVHYFLEKIPP
jgi:hypothetical protein